MSNLRVDTEGWNKKKDSSHVLLDPPKDYLKDDWS
jgi:hypothetical protein